ncbi:MAG: hypothetical protein ACNA8W_16890, partial [Bradymonadaceae bacterium]
MNTASTASFLEILAPEPERLEEVRGALAILGGYPDFDAVLKGATQLVSTEEGRAALRKPGALAVYIKLAIQGRYPTLMLCRHPEDLSYLVDALAMRAPSVEEMAEELRVAIVVEVGRLAMDGNRIDIVESELRRFKRRQSLRIFHEEIEGQASVRQTTAEIADVAEACLTVGVEEVARSLGDESLVEDFCILGMGKLGGRELNYSSDIDLVYLGSDRLREDPERRGAVDQLARRLTALIDETTPDGYVFRVDLRL